VDLDGNLWAHVFGVAFAISFPGGLCSAICLKIVGIGKQVPIPPLQFCIFHASAVTNTDLPDRHASASQFEFIAFLISRFGFHRETPHFIPCF